MGVWWVIEAGWRMFFVGLIFGVALTTQALGWWVDWGLRKLDRQLFESQKKTKPEVK